MISEKVGIGCELSYTTLKMNYQETQTSFTGTVNTTNTYDYTWQITTLRAMFRTNIHFANAENFDAYFLISAGYRGTQTTFTSTDPDFGKITIPSIIPFGMKPGLGLRYFFTKNVGLNLEIALGAPIMGGGISFKF